MKLKDVTSRKHGIKTDLNIKIENDEIVGYIPSFTPNQVVTLKPEFKSYSSDHTKISGKQLKVEECRISDLGDMLVEVVRFHTTDTNNVDEDGELIVDKLIRNPYLAEHFILV